MDLSLTTFEIQTKPDIRVIKKYGSRVEKEKVCLTVADAKVLRDYWVNEFWGFKLN